MMRAAKVARSRYGWCSADGASRRQSELGRRRRLLTLRAQQSAAEELNEMEEVPIGRRLLDCRHDNEGLSGCGEKVRVHRRKGGGCTGAPRDEAHGKDEIELNAVKLQESAGAREEWGGARLRRMMACVLTCVGYCRTKEYRRRR
eukprot:4328579-Pleurochrysis_carterae.AAC.1